MMKYFSARNKLFRTFWMTAFLVLICTIVHPQFVKLNFTQNQLEQNRKSDFTYDAKSQQSYLIPHKSELQTSLDNGSAQKVQRLNFLSQAVALPFKYRLQSNGQWEAGFSLGSASGVQWLTSKKNPKSNYLGLLLYVGASQLATIDSTNSKDSTGATRIGPTFAFTGFWQITKWNNCDFEFTLGWDYDPKNRTDQWLYNGKPWISFGIGINLTQSTQSGGSN